MNKMKTFLTIKSGCLSIFLLVSILFTSCKKDFLDRKPLGQYTEEDLSSGSLEGLIFAAYAALRHDGLSGLAYVSVHNMRADDADKGSSPGDGVDAEDIFDNFNYSKDFWLINEYWAGQYNLSALANNVISIADSIGGTDPATQTNIGEARFFRALAYFNLVRSFGEVPLIDFRITEASQAVEPKSSIAEIYALIDSDLEFAASVLPQSKDWGGRFPGRLTKGAANALQAKTFLARNQWGKALAATQQVISSGEYDINTPYQDVFREANENGKESVFEVQAKFYQSIKLGINYASRQGVRGAGEWNLGWGWNVPNQILADAFEEGDPRKDATLLYTGQVNTPYGEFVPAGLDRPYWSKKVYTNPAIRRSSGSLQGEWFNMRVIRYSDVLLMAAEAANEVGGEANTLLALDYLEQVRARARGSNAAVLPPVTTINQEELRQAIRHERQVELGMENERFFDLIRWGIAENVFQAAGKTNFQPRNRFLPIPQPEIDKSDGVLVQNPDY
jgi:hypothetical protein